MDVEHLHLVKPCELRVPKAQNFYSGLARGKHPIHPKVVGATRGALGQMSPLMGLYSQLFFVRLRKNPKYFKNQNDTMSLALLLRPDVTSPPQAGVVNYIVHKQGV